MALCVSYFLARVSEDMGRIDLRPDYGNYIWRVHGVSPPRSRGRPESNLLPNLTAAIDLQTESYFRLPSKKITAQPADEAT